MMDENNVVLTIVSDCESAHNEGGEEEKAVGAAEVHTTRPPPPDQGSGIELADRSMPTKLEFEVTLAKNGDELGIDVLQPDPGTLLVNNIKAGPMMSWNQMHPDLSVRPGDRIFAVNGLTGSAEDLIREVRNNEMLILGIRRIMWMEIQLKKEPGGKLGIDVAQHADHLRILRLRPGPFLDWNNESTFDRQVRVSDKIVEVNGARGSAQDLLQAINNASETMSVLIQHTSRSELSPDDRLGRQRAARHLMSSVEQRPVAQGHCPKLGPPVEARQDDKDNEPPGGHFTLVIE